MHFIVSFVPLIGLHFVRICFCLPDSPHYRSPVKQRAKIEGEGKSAGASGGSEAEHPTGVDLLEEFSSFNQAVSESISKEMMLALCSSLQSNVMSMLSKFTDSFYDLGEIVNNIKVKMGEFSKAHYGLVNTHNSV